MPSILRLASQPSLGKSDTESFCTCINDSLAEVERAGYKLQALVESPDVQREAVAPGGTQNDQAEEPEPASSESDSEIETAKRAR